MWSFIHSVLASKEEEESEPFHQNVFMLRLPWQRSEEPHLSFQRAKPQVVGFLLRTEADNLTRRLRSEPQTDSLTPLFYVMNKHLTANHLKRSRCSIVHGDGRLHGVMKVWRITCSVCLSSLCTSQQSDEVLSCRTLSSGCGFVHSGFHDLSRAAR